MSKQNIKKLINQADSLFQKGEMEKALKTYSIAHSLVKGSNSLQEVEITRNIAMSQYHLGETKESLKLLKKILLVAKSKKYLEQEVEATREISLMYLTIGELEPAIKNADKSLKLARENNFKEAEINVMACIGYIYSTKGEFEKALVWFQEGLDKAKIIKFIARIITLSLDTARMHSYIGNYSKSIEMLNEVLRISKNDEYMRYYTIAIYRMGDNYASIGDIDQGLALLNKSYALAQKYKYKDIVGDNLHRLGKYSIQVKEYIEAIKYLNEALKIFREEGHKWKELSTILAIGNYYEENGKHDQALQNYWQVYKEIKNKPEQIMLYIEAVKDICNVFFKLDRAEEAKTILDFVNVLDMLKDQKGIVREFHKNVQANTCISEINKRLEKLEGIQKGFYRYKDIYIDFNKHRASKNKKIIHLTPHQFKILKYLNSYGNVPCPRKELFKAIGLPENQLSRTIDVQLDKIRNVLGDDVIVTIKNKCVKLKR